MESISRQYFAMKKATYLQSYAITQTVFEHTLKTVKRGEKPAVLGFVFFFF